MYLFKFCAIGCFCLLSWWPDHDDCSNVSSPTGPVAYEAPPNMFSSSVESSISGSETLHTTIYSPRFGMVVVMGQLVLGRLPSILELKTFSDLLSGFCVEILMDNKTAVAYIAIQGSTKSLPF